MRIGIMGTRGIPNAYGGFEQFAEQVATELVARGHEVAVYNSSLHPFKNANWKGVDIIRCKDWEHRFRAVGQFLYDLNCIRDSQKRNFDVLLHLGYTSDSIWHHRWPNNSVNIVNMDGLEWKRQKYSRLTKIFLKKAESLAANYANALIADSKQIQKYLLSKYNKHATYIPYPAEIFETPDKSSLDKLHLVPQQFYLLIARMEPENNVETIIKSVLDSGQNLKLLVVGEIKNKYGSYLRRKYVTEQIVFTGGIYNKELLNNLRYYSRIYFHGHSVGGTNPSLLEAMACSCRIVAHDNIFNREVLSSDADFFSGRSQLVQIIRSKTESNLIEQRVRNNLQKIQAFYSLDKIVTDYEMLMKQSISNAGTLQLSS